MTYQRTIGTLVLLHAIWFAAPKANAQQPVKATTATITTTTTDAISILAWNIELGGSEPATIQQQLDQLAPFDILALSEVPKKSSNEFTKRWGEGSSLVGEKGGEACLLISWNPDKFEKIQVQECRGNEHALELLDATVRAGGEGLMANRGDALYVGERTGARLRLERRLVAGNFRRASFDGHGRRDMGAGM